MLNPAHPIVRLYAAIADTTPEAAVDALASAPDIIGRLTRAFTQIEADIIASERSRQRAEAIGAEVEVKHMSMTIQRAPGSDITIDAEADHQVLMFIPGERPHATGFIGPGSFTISASKKTRFPVIFAAVPREDVSAWLNAPDELIAAIFGRFELAHPQHDAAD